MSLPGGEVTSGHVTDPPTCPNCRALKPTHFSPRDVCPSCGFKPGPETVPAPGSLRMSLYAHSQTCDICGTVVRFQMCAAPSPELPSFVQATFPEGCWIGWSWVDPDGYLYGVRPSPLPPEARLSLLVLCSQLCLVAWFQDADDRLKTSEVERVLSAPEQ